MKIMQITPCLPPDGGGIGIYVYNLSKQLAERGYSVSIVFRGTRNKRYDLSGIPVHEVKTIGWPPLNHRILKNRIKQVIVTEKPDIVHVHHGAMPIPETEIPVLVTAHCCCREIIQKLHRPVKNLENLYKNTTLPLYVRSERTAVRSCNRLTVVSESLRKEFYTHYKTDSSVVYNAVDTDLFKPSNKTDRKNLILFTGRLVKGKGLFDLLRVAELLLKSHDSKTVVCIAGNGPLRKALQNRIRKLRLNNVMIMPHILNSMLPSLYHCAGVFLLPSSYEGLSTSILEAMACGVPVVTTRNSSMPEQIDHGINGYLAQDGDINSLYSHARELLEDRGKQKQLGDAAREKVLTEFSWTRISNLITDHYKNLSRA